MRIALCVVRYLLVGFGMLLVAIALLAAIEQVQAQDTQTMVVATGVWCDKAEQSQSLFDLVVRKDKPLIDGITTVNGAAKPPACAVSTIILIPGDLVVRIEHEGKSYGVYAVMVLAFQHGGRMVRLPSPLLQFGTKPIIEEPGTSA